MKHQRNRQTARRVAVLCLGGVMLLAGCGSPPGEPLPNPVGKTREEVRREQRGSILGDDALTFSVGREQESEGGGGGIGVNSFLWRASLDTLAFMPVNSADPFGGVILTDWYSPPQSPGERFKINVYILDRQLRADGIRVSVFRQVRDPAGAWVDAPVAEDTALALEDTILTRAREFRVTSLAAAR